MQVMSEYFLKLPGDSQPRAYSEYEVREFLGQGVIDSKTLTWKQGMEGWQPVAQVFRQCHLYGGKHKIKRAKINQRSSSTACVIL